MKLKEFVAQIPFLVGASNAARISEVFAFVFARELEGGTPFDRNEEDRKFFENRSIYLWDMLFGDEGADVEACTLCQKLMEIIERTHYRDKHGEKEQAPFIEKACQQASALQAQFPEIEKAMPVSLAETLSFWDAD